jgi:Protein of unknown function (DUF3570)
MQFLSSSAAPSALVCGLMFLGCANANTVGVTTAASALYSRTDSNRTTVWSPRLRVAGKVGESLGVETAIAVDAWTGASVDVTTAATKAIHEVRKEVNAGGYYALPHVTVGGGYRYSTENDYWSNGGVGTLTFDMADKNTTLVLAGFGSHDIVGRSHDRGFKEPQTSAGGRVTLTQVLDASTLAQLSWETTHVNGYQASPYRFVAVGGIGVCRGSPSSSTKAVDGCGPELVPTERYRNAASARGRRAFGDHVSVGLEYRLYFDNWGVRSHTIMPDVALLLSDHDTLVFDYRYYTQGAADFYKPRYLSPSDALGYRTRDRELSALYSNRVGLRYQHGFEFADGARVLTTALRWSVTRYRYLAFVGLSSVDALEATLLISLDWR